MSNQIWNNPLMWQTKTSNPDDDFNFEFQETPSLESDFDIDAEFDFDDVADEYKDFKQESSFADSAAKSAEYKESTPQVAGGNNPSSLEQELSNALEPKSTSQTSDPTYSFNLVLQTNATQEIPSLEALIGGSNTNNSNIYQVDEDDDSNLILIDQLGITTDDVFNKGVSIGLSPLDIVDNLNNLRNALALEKLTGDSLDSQELTELYQASLNGDIKATEIILNNNNITLDNSVSIDDILALSQNANNKIFKSAYLN